MFSILIKDQYYNGDGKMLGCTVKDDLAQDGLKRGLSLYQQRLHPYAAG